MFVIKAHFDGSVIVPDEPVNLPQQASVFVLADSSDGAAMWELDATTRRYYQERSPDDGKEDDGWGETLSKDSSNAWEKE